jgi:hypothetical protein
MKLQVYIIGTGTNSQFTSNPRQLLKTAHYTMDGFDQVIKAWKQVRPCVYMHLQ